MTFPAEEFLHHIGYQFVPCDGLTGLVTDVGGLFSNIVIESAVDIGPEPDTIF